MWSEGGANARLGGLPHLQWISMVVGQQGPLRVRVGEELGFFCLLFAPGQPASPLMSPFLSLPGCYHPSNF